MISAKEWDDFLAPFPAMTNALVKVGVETHAREKLKALSYGQKISTNQLVEMLYPRAEVRSVASDTARARIYKALSELAPIIMRDCCERGEIQGTFMGKPKRPWLWHAPLPKNICHECGQEIKEVP